MPSAPESLEDYYARILASTDDEGRLPVAVELMPGWDIFPYELDSLRMKPIQPLLESEPPRSGEDPDTCRCATRDPEAPERGVVWRNERWRLSSIESGLPVFLVLGPWEHHDIADLPDELAREMGLLLVAITAAVEALPSVGRAQIARYGDGSAHAHPFILGRPARMGQLRGSPLIDWEENLPRVPEAVAVANALAVAERLVQRVGGRVTDPRAAG